MLTNELISATLPSLRLYDTIDQALQWMSENQVCHLPVTEHEKFIGLIGEDDLRQADDAGWPVSNLQPLFSDHCVKEEEHFLKALQLAAELRLSIVPVVNQERDFVGSILYKDLLRFSSEFLNLAEPGALLVLSLPSQQYSLAEINKIIEQDNAQITQLNTSADAAGQLLITIRINKPEISSLAAAFQRYGYEIKYCFGEELYHNELKGNYENLMNYLSM